MYFRSVGSSAAQIPQNPILSASQNSGVSFFVNISPGLRGTGIVFGEGFVGLRSRSLRALSDFFCHRSRVWILHGKHVSWFTSGRVARGARVRRQRWLMQLMWWDCRFQIL